MYNVWALRGRTTECDRDSRAKQEEKVRLEKSYRQKAEGIKWEREREREREQGGGGSLATRCVSPAKQRVLVLSECLLRVSQGSDLLSRRRCSELTGHKRFCSFFPVLRSRRIRVLKVSFIDFWALLSPAPWERAGVCFRLEGSTRRSST